MPIGVPSLIAQALAWLAALLAPVLAPFLTLASVEQIDDFPLYTMHYYGEVETNLAVIEAALTAARLDPAQSPAYADPDGAAVAAPGWACSLFAAFVDPDQALYGRNFDWQYSPAVLLFNHPPDGYDSVTMVDIAYLGIPGRNAGGLAERPLLGRLALLQAPGLPFDGMNDQGLAIGMAAVPFTRRPHDPDLETVNSVEIIRRVLDHAATVDEALAIFAQHNLDMTGGPPLHYLVADAAGHSALIEFGDGEMLVMRNQQPWDLATNFLRSQASGSPESHCWRYRTISERLSAAGGRLAPADALQILRDVSQDSTQWSIVYGMSTGTVDVVMHRQYETVHHLALALE